MANTGIPTRRILVTGANKGLGFGITKLLLKEDPLCLVLMGVRDLKRGQEALEYIIAHVYDAKDRVQLLEIDVSSTASVQQAVEEVATRFGRDPPPLHGIINNAGVADDDMEHVLNVNVNGPLRVCSMFIGLLQQKSGRIVNVSSAAGPMFVSKCSPERQAFFKDPNVTWDQIEAVMAEAKAVPHDDKAAFAAKGLDEGSPYGLSKALLNSYTMFLARTHPLMYINSCTPGLVNTDMARPLATKEGKTPEELGMKDPEEGACCPVYLMLGRLEGNGRFYGSDVLRSPLDRYRAPGEPAYDGP